MTVGSVHVTTAIGRPASVFLVILSIVVICGTSASDKQKDGNVINLTTTRQHDQKQTTKQTKTKTLTMKCIIFHVGYVLGGFLVINFTLIKIKILL